MDIETAKSLSQPVTSLASLTQLCHGDKKTLARQLMSWGLIPPEDKYICEKCGGLMKLVNDRVRPDGLRWKCGGFIQKPRQKRKKCTATMGFRTGTFFAHMKLSMIQCLGFVNFWVSHISLTSACKELAISIPTAVSWATFCREVILGVYILNKQKLGGCGKAVEIYKSKFKKRKYYDGQSGKGQWVLGGYEQGTGRVFMIPVENCSVDTLLLIIDDWICDETTIISDFWKTYDRPSLQKCDNLKIKHSFTFKDPNTGACMDAIESPWWAAKITSSSGRQKVHIPGNLARYFFEKRCTELKLDRTVEFYRLAGQLCNPMGSTSLPPDEQLTDISDIDE